MMHQLLPKYYQVHTLLLPASILLPKGDYYYIIIQSEFLKGKRV